MNIYLSIKTPNINYTWAKTEQKEERSPRRGSGRRDSRQLNK